MLFGETVAVYCENHTEHTNTLCGQNAEFLMLKYAEYVLITVFWRIKLNPMERTITKSPQCPLRDRRFGVCVRGQLRQCKVEQRARGTWQTLTSRAYCRSLSFHFIAHSSRAFPHIKLGISREHFQPVTVITDTRYVFMFGHVKALILSF
jgi:hypothetical protein